MGNRISKAVFPVAGTTHLSPFREERPGELSELRTIVDRPIIQFAIDEARAAGIEEFIFVTCNERLALENHLAQSWPKNFDMVSTARATTVSSGEAVFIRQLERRGIGHAILMAHTLLEGEPFAVIIPNLLVLGETPPMQDMVAVYEADTVSIGALEVTKEDVARFGILETERGRGNGLYRVASVVEKPETEQAPSRLAAFGRWILPPAALKSLQVLAESGVDQITLTDCINAMVPTTLVRALRLSGTYYDLRSRSAYVRATVAYALSSPETSQAVSDAYDNYFDAGIRTIQSIDLSRRYADLTSLALLAQVVERDFAGEIALVSSFGADSAVLLHMVSRIDPATPVLFVDTGKLFQETLLYQQELSERLGLVNVHVVRPSEDDQRLLDPDDTLHNRDKSVCCSFRKIAPLAGRSSLMGRGLQGASDSRARSVPSFLGSKKTTMVGSRSTH